MPVTCMDNTIPDSLIENHDINHYTRWHHNAKWHNSLAIAVWIFPIIPPFHASLESHSLHCCCWVVGLDDLFTSSWTAEPPFCIRSIASECVMRVVLKPLISNSWSPTWKAWHTSLNASSASLDQFLAARPYHSDFPLHFSTMLKIVCYFANL